MQTSGTPQGQWRWPPAHRSAGKCNQSINGEPTYITRLVPEVQEHSGTSANAEREHFMRVITKPRATRGRTRSAWLVAAIGAAVIGLSAPGASANADVLVSAPHVLVHFSLPAGQQPE